MRRFARNRWWAFLLVLSVLLAGSTVYSHVSYGDGIDPIAIGGGDSGGSAPGGDPDGPAGPGKTGAHSGRVAPGGFGYASSTVGDGGTLISTWSGRFHIVWRLLIGRYFRI